MSTKAKAPKLPGTLTALVDAWRANRTTIATQRATIAKLWKELAKEVDTSITFEERGDQYHAEAETWKAAHQQLANAVWRKA